MYSKSGVFLPLLKCLLHLSGKQYEVKLLHLLHFSTPLRYRDLFSLRQESKYRIYPFIS